MLGEPKGYAFSQQSTSGATLRMLEGIGMKKENHGLKYLRNGRVNRGQPVTLGRNQISEV